MTLGEKQELFAENFGKLIAWVYEQGWALRIGEVHRPDETAEIYAKKGKGIKNSVHRLKLAADIFLSIDGEVTWDVESYRPLGDYWKSLNSENRWGGDMLKRRDAVHFSMIHNGVW